MTTSQLGYRLIVYSLQYKGESSMSEDKVICSTCEQESDTDSTLCSECKAKHESLSGKNNKPDRLHSTNLCGCIECTETREMQKRMNLKTRRSGAFVRKADSMYEKYDTAVPQPWADSMRDEFGFYPPGHFVWCYDEGCSLFGKPAPVTLAAVRFMSRMLETVDSASMYLLQFHISDKLLISIIRDYKLRLLVEENGVRNIEELCSLFIADSVVPGICTKADCDNITEVEVDARKNYCDECGMFSMYSLAVLVGAV
jgi:hypothetical protein